MKLDEAVTRFLDALRLRQYSPNTIDDYGYDLRQMLRFIEPSATVDGFDHPLVERYLCHLAREGRVGPATVKRRKDAIRAFAKWTASAGLLPENPLANFRHPVRLPRYLPRPLTREELRKIFIAADESRRSASSPWQSYDNFLTTLAVELLFSTGMRIGELVRIELDDISWDDLSLTINGKGRRQRRVFIPTDELAAMLRAFIQQRETVRAESRTLLVNRIGRALSTESMRRRIRRLVRSAGVERHITPHMFRHSTATYMLEEGVDIRFVQRLLGHASINTTVRYIHVADEALRRIVAERHPRRTLFAPDRL